MRFRLLTIATLLTLTPALFAQSPAWQPAPGHLTLHLWPHGAPGEPPHPPAEVNLTTPRSGRVAGRSIVRLTNVSDPTLTLYKPSGHNTGTAVIVFPGGGYKVLGIDISGTEICQ